MFKSFFILNLLLCLSGALLPKSVQAQELRLSLSAPNSIQLYAQALEQKTTQPKIKTITLEQRLAFYGVGFGAALATVPLALKTAAFLGTVSNELSASLLMPISVFLLAPTGAVVWGQDTYAHKQALKRRSWLWPFFAGMGVQLAGFVTGAMLGVNTQNLQEMVAFSFVQALLLPAVTTLIFAPAPNPDIAPVTSARTFPALPEARNGVSGSTRPFVALPLMALTF